VTYVLPILPDEIRCEVADGVVAVLRPLDHGELATLLDTYPASADGNLPVAAGPWVVKRQLLRVDGLSMGADGVPFDPRNPLHHASLPWSWVNRCASALYARMNVSEETAKNSDAPSVLVVPTDGAA
jgi:hypothetical protein